MNKKKVLGIVIIVAVVLLIIGAFTLEVTASSEGNNGDPDDMGGGLRGTCSPIKIPDSNGDPDDIGGGF
ncbi:MAG: hypothetical protein V1726_08300 [Methanobacteriota archaeon]